MDKSRPLALVSDEELLDDLLRVAAAAGCELERVPDAAAIRVRWHQAPLIVLDERGAAECLQAKLPRREGIILAACGPLEQRLWEQAVLVGAERVIGLPEEESWLAGALSDSSDHPAESPGRVVSVVGGRGGAGASVFAAALSFTALRSGRQVLLMDCDPLGGGLDLVLGAEDESGLRWPDLRLSSGRIATTSLHSALPSRGRDTARLSLLSCDRTGVGPDPQAVTTIITSARRAGELVVCDIPRCLTEASRSVLALTDLAILVVPAEIRACASAKRVSSRLIEQGVTPHLVVRGPAPCGLRAKDVAEAVGLSLLGAMKAEPGLAETLERGQPPAQAKGPLRTTANAILQDLYANRLSEAA